MGESSSLISPEPQTLYCLYHSHKWLCSQVSTAFWTLSIQEEFPLRKTDGPRAQSHVLYTLSSVRRHAPSCCIDHALNEPWHAFLSAQSKPPLPSSCSYHPQPPSGPTQHILSDVESSALLFFAAGFVILDFSLFQSPKSFFPFPKPQVIILLVPHSVILFLSLKISN